jgi:hypothetical protein
MKALRPKGLWWTHDHSWNRGSEQHRIVVIEYRNRRPFSVVTEEHWDHTERPWFVPGRDKPNGTVAAYWDFEWCKRDRNLYFHMSGIGGDPLAAYLCSFSKPDLLAGLLWAAPDVRFRRWISSKRPEVAIRSDSTLLSMGYRRVSRPLLLSGGEWAATKRSRNPFLVASETDSPPAYCRICDDYFPTDMECEHLEWCDRCGCLVYIDTHVREDEPGGEPIVHMEEE